MSPQEAFEAFVDHADAGKIYDAAEAAADYNKWAEASPYNTLTGETIDGVPGLATDSLGDDVVRCDHEQDRYGVRRELVVWDVGTHSPPRYVDRWRAVHGEAARMVEAEQRRCKDDALQAMGEAQERNATRGDQ